MVTRPAHIAGKLYSNVLRNARIRPYRCLKERNRGVQNTIINSLLLRLLQVYQEESRR